MTTYAQTAHGARQLDRAAATEATARAAREQAATREAEALVEIRVAEARAEAARRAQDRDSARRDALAERAAARRAAAIERRAQRRAVRAAVWTQRRPLLVVVPMMATSAAVALPAQFEYYRARTGSDWSAATIAAMVEGGTWLGAALESAARDRGKPAGFYQGLTWVLAGAAAGVNLAHGLAMKNGGWQVGAVFALASLMGVISWSAYMRLRTHEHAEVSAEQVRLAMWRRLRYPRLSWQAASLRAAIGTQLGAEQAWAQVWDEHHGPRRVETAPTRVEARVEAVEPALESVDLDPGEGRPGVPVRVEVDPIALLWGTEAVEPLMAVEAGAFTGRAASLDPVEVDPAPVPVPAGRGTAGPGLDRPQVEPVWIEPALSEASEDSPWPEGISDRTDEALLAELGAAIEGGDLPPHPSAEAVRQQLKIRWARANSLLEQRDARAKATPVEDVDRAAVEVDRGEGARVRVGAV